MTIASFMNYIEAEMARGLLESHEVEVFLVDDNLARMTSYVEAVAIGGTKLKVRRSDEDTARGILSSLDSESSGTAVCSKCGFENTTDFLECVSCGHIPEDVPEHNGGDAVEPILTCDTDPASRTAGDGGASPESDPLLCPACETPYRLEDYNPQALRIYCSSCKAELPRHGSRRF